MKSSYKLSKSTGVGMCSDCPKSTNWIFFDGRTGEERFLCNKCFSSISTQKRFKSIFMQNSLLKIEKMGISRKNSSTKTSKELRKCETKLPKPYSHSRRMSEQYRDSPAVGTFNLTTKSVEVLSK